MNIAQPVTPEDAFGESWRQQLLARLAAERAYLLLQYRGLNEDTLTQIPASGDLTFKDVLLHVAAWDAFHTEKISLVRHDRAAALQPLTPESLNRRNAILAEQFQAIPLEQALATCLKERAGFLAELKLVSNEALHRRFTTPSGKRERLRTWARWRFLHDMNHASELETWRSKQPPDVGPGYLLRAIFNATRKEFLTLVDLIPTDEHITRPVCGVWGLKDLVGHLTDWEHVGLDGLRQLAAGHTPEFDYEIPDFDTFNNKNAAARSAQSWAEVWADFTSTRQAFTDLFDHLSPEALTRPIPTPWGSTISAYVWVLVWAGHEHEHAIDVRSSLALRNWPRRLTKHS
ncbi:MAG: DinB family protein [Anaerolineae bacterium]|nr:DinB family protein [Anaerolineae bacterium]